MTEFEIRRWILNARADAEACKDNAIRARVRAEMTDEASCKSNDYIEQAIANTVATVERSRASHEETKAKIYATGADTAEKMLARRGTAR